jgi:DNA repair exonuclease SbcCD ATPase subunit
MGSIPQMSDTPIASQAKPTSVKELFKAWKVSDFRAHQLESKLRETAKSAQRYRRDLLKLVEQNQLRKQQSDGLRSHLLQVLERQVPATQVATIEIPQDAEAVPAHAVHNLLVRLRESQELVEEYQTLLQFRENQVQELLARPVDTNPSASRIKEDFLTSQLQQRLSEARHRIRLLTKELAAAQQLTPPPQSPGEEELTQQLQRREQQLRDLAAQVQPIQEAVKRLQAALQESQQKLQAAEAKLADAPASTTSSEAEDLFQEILSLQEEVGRLQEDNLKLQEQIDATGDTQAFRDQIQELEQRLEMETQKSLVVEALQEEASRLYQENESLRQAAVSNTRNEKLEAAVIELKNKLQLAATKYHEVKQMLLDKHRELNELKAATPAPADDALVPVVRTLESALDQARQEAERYKAQLAEAQKAAPVAAPAASGDAAALEAKLKEARRSAVRAQAEAGMKRKEAAKIQEDLDAALAKLKAHGIA